jgi:hypothetical protein
MKHLLILATLLVALLSIPQQSWSGLDQLVAGAGPSTKVAELFFKFFNNDPACTDYHFSVMPSSIKHKGGILSSEKNLFGRTGRPLKANERALGKEEILLGRVPIAITAGLETGVKSITLKQLKKIVTRKITNWKEVGGSDNPILLVGREETEALFSTLKRDYPFYQQARFDKIFNNDDAVVKFLISPDGANAIAFGAKQNFNQYNLLPVKGFSSGVPLGLVYDLINKDHPVILAAKKFANSIKWKKQLKSIDMLPVD